MEQLNQSFTYLVVLAGMRHLLNRDPNLKFAFNPATSKGFDLIGFDENQTPKLVGEAFAAVNVTNNQKLKKDIESIQSKLADGAWKALPIQAYIFYYVSKKTPDETDQNLTKDIPKNLFIIPIDSAKLWLPKN